MKILLIGGSGIISTEVCRLAIDQGNDVYILNRGKRKNFIHEKAHLVVADIRNESIECIKEKFSGLYFDVVVDFISFKVDELKKSTSIFSDMCDQYIFISSATVYEKQTAGGVISENTRLYNPDWNYANDKIVCEEFIQKLYEAKEGKYYTIIRPYVTYGVTRIPFGVIPDHANYTLINRMIHNKPVVLWDGGEALCTLTYSKDFAVGVVGLFKNKKAYGEAFHIASPVSHRWKDVYNELCGILGVKDNHISIPTDYIVKCMPRYRNNLLGDKARDMVFDTSKICDAVPEFTERTSLREGLLSVVEYYNGATSAKAVDYKWDGQIDRMISNYTKSVGMKVNRKMLSSRSYGKISVKNHLQYLICRNKILFSIANMLMGK